MVLININGTVSERLAECQDGGRDIKVKQEAKDNDLDLQLSDPDPQGGDPDIECQDLEDVQGHSTIDPSTGHVISTLDVSGDSDEKASISENLENSNTDKTANQPGKRKRGWSTEHQRPMEYETLLKKQKLSVSEKDGSEAFEAISKAESGSLNIRMDNHGSTQNEASVVIATIEAGPVPETCGKRPRVKPQSSEFMTLKKEKVDKVSSEESASSHREAAEHEKSKYKMMRVTRKQTLRSLSLS